MKTCKYRNCEKRLPEQSGPGRKRHFCNRNCKRMELYYLAKDKKTQLKGME